jgi:N-acetyl-anhydromuramyl-L-alanine amidase AmpD
VTLPAITWREDYLDRSPNKDSRDPAQVPLGVLLHETASPNPDNSPATLTYNLDPNVASSYHVLVGRDGVAWAYLTSQKYIAWHAGKGAWTLPSGRVLVNYDLNKYLLGIELDGRNNGEPVTPEQITTAALLCIMYANRYAFPLLEGYITEHKKVALPPGRKSDPMGTTAAAVVKAAHQLLGGC